MDHAWTLLEACILELVCVGGGGLSGGWGLQDLVIFLQRDFFSAFCDLSNYVFVAEKQ